MYSQVNNVWETLNWIYSNIITAELIELIDAINQLNEYSIINIKFWNHETIEVYWIWLYIIATWIEFYYRINRIRWVL